MVKVVLGQEDKYNGEDYGFAFAGRRLFRLFVALNKD